MSFREDLEKTIRYAMRNGLKETYYAAGERLRQRRSTPYVYEAPSPEILEKQRKDAKQWTDGPLFSILVPSYLPNPVFLKEMLDSVAAQTYPRWELILADASEAVRITGRSSLLSRTEVQAENYEEEVRPEAEQILNDLGDDRFHYVHLPANGGISANTNAAAAHAAGDYIALLDYDDLLTPDALYEAAAAIRLSSPEILYSDEDKCDETAQHFFEPNRKPDFNEEYFLSNNYICHLLVMKRELFLALQLRSKYDGAQDYDLLLRAPKSYIAHIPKVLYHWRTHAASTAGNPGSKDYAYEAGKAALEEHLAACGIRAKVTHSRHRGFYDIQYLPDLFSARGEVGVIGGKVLDRKGRIVGGMMDEKGNVAFEGLHAMESGPMHRADTRQTAVAVDARCMEIRPELKPLYQEIFGAAYEDHIMQGGEQLRSRSIEFCHRARLMGYRTVFEPTMTKTVQQ